MAKSKGKGPKQKNVFHVANSKCMKAKNKAKPVKTSLKKINVCTSEKVITINKVFTEIEKEVVQAKQNVPSNQIKKKQKPSVTQEAPPDVDQAADLFSHL
ncbi:ribosomal biogenesis factor [Xenopus laevis]|uniref:Ribosomal biogenesis factor n=2 Tax=Xenopus laevis TaxID=8355 RepID=A0A974CLL7_XENLA|nr:ribosomal biogenesis factor [Xenopus laevis]OCT74856.1 hypothetical protein XELAEV_18033844mg [Xenopus laevis]